jgi:energy-coupling factor transporter ATP-binding protein EcfA2
VQEPIKVYISYVEDDLEIALHIYKILSTNGFSPWIAHENVLIGENIADVARKARRNTEIFIACVSNKSASDSNFLNGEFQDARNIYSNKSLSGESYYIIPIALDGYSPLPDVIKNFRGATIDRDSITLEKDLLDLVSQLRKLYKQNSINSPISTSSSTLPRKYQNLLIAKVEIVNIRCFQSLIVDFEADKEPIRWAMILGDNAVGKTTLLRSIALGLCNESDAVALMKSVPGDFVRKGAEEGYIKIHLREDKNAKRPKKYTITTTISQKSEGAPEIVRQETEPEANFPWADIFVCGYGAYRASQAQASYEQYKVMDAVRSLFDPQVSLQNPEIVLLRRDPEVRSQLEQKLLSILMLDLPDCEINYTKRGIELDGPWGRLPFQVLSDGYRSTTQWVLDFMGWLIQAERLIGNPDIGGILLIDEIEQHLHPRWQRYIVQRLRKQFPKTQIIASTHTPLAASGMVDVDQSVLLKLEQRSGETHPAGNREIDLRVIDKQLLAGKRADQVLASEAFGLVTTRNLGSEDQIDRYTELLGKTTRSDQEEAELQELRSHVQNALQSGESEVEQMVERALDEALQGMIQNTSPELLNLETKKQLQQLFQTEVSG